ncbi:hypothetical protein OIU77_010431 [Salix suchowensis]|uniref:Uncharacterized protein n=1 Tax=Salix suchowensis TaxID=1278906 RepID=A0ABQ9A9A7_9ROSI|nr:hypothetical protein OIU77_010431 [Salix suchowensis]
MFLDPDADLSIPLDFEISTRNQLVQHYFCHFSIKTEESELNIIINGRQTNEASSPKTAGLQRPQSPGKICPETATYKEDISASFTPAKEKTVQTLLSSMLMLLNPSLYYRDSPSGNLRVTKKSDGTYLTAKMVARIEVRNPNEKIMYHFGESEVGTTMGDEEVNLGSTSLPKFKQEKGNATSLKTVTSVKSELVEDRIGSAILNQFKNKKLKETESGEMPRCVMKILKWIVVR